MRLKDRIVYGGLLLFTLWPAAHMWLVHRFDLSPWKAAGWGMYSAPRLSQFGMEVYGRAEGQAEFEKLTAPPADLHGEGSAFLERRRWLGELARPDGFAAAVLRLYPQWREVRVVVFRPELDRGTGMVVLRSATYEYPAAHDRN